MAINDPNDLLKRANAASVGDIPQATSRAQGAPGFSQVYAPPNPTVNVNSAGQPQPSTAASAMRQPPPTASAPPPAPPPVDRWDSTIGERARAAKAQRLSADAGMGAPIGPQPNPAAPPPVATSGSAANAMRGGEAASRAVRFGATPVETKPGLIGARTAPGQRAGTGALLAPIAIASAADSGATDTSNYATRFGIDEAARAPGSGVRDWIYDKLGASPATRESGESFAKGIRDLGIRTAGTLTDLGAAIPDTAIGMANATGATDIRPIGSMFNDRAGDYKPVYATDQGGLAIRPGAVSAIDQERNKAWETNMLRERLAQMGGAAPGATSDTGAAPAIEPPQGLRPDRATSAATKDWSASAQAAMNSTAPGTAVINGRVVGQDEIKALESRNVLSSAPLAPGVAYSMATGGGTLPLGAGPTRGSAASQLGAGFIDREYSGGIGGPPTAAEARRRETDALARQIVSLAESGRNRSAATLLGLFRETVGRQNGEVQAAGRARSPVEDQLALAQAGRQNADADVARLQAAQAARAAVIQEQLLNEPDLKKRQQLEWTLAAMRGQGVTQARERMQRLKVPVGQGIDARDLELPYDPDTNQLVIPQGLAELMVPPKPKEKK